MEDLHGGRPVSLLRNALDGQPSAVAVSERACEERRERRRARSAGPSDVQFGRNTKSAAATGRSMSL
jgi:hypothetical protein